MCTNKEYPDRFGSKHSAFFSDIRHSNTNISDNDSLMDGVAINRSSKLSLSLMKMLFYHIPIVSA